MGVELTDKRNLPGRKKKKTPVLSPSLASQHYLCLASVLQTYEAA